MLMPLRRSALSRWLPERACPWAALVLILAAAGLHLAYLACDCPLDLAQDEAHYWDWSRHLDWSYYSKGPLVAWLIRGSCELAGGWSERCTGNLALAVRLPAVVCGSLLLASLYLLTVQVLGSRRLGLAVVAVALTLPPIAAGSSLMTIDAPYTCCWGWALVLAHRAVFGKSAWAWEACGVVIGLGVLAKYTMAVFVPSLALFLLTTPAHRRQFFSAGFWSMVGVALLCSLPILVWNAQHDWVTFRHVLRLAGLGPADAPGGGSAGLRWWGPLTYVGVQTAVLLGYWFFVWLAAMAAHNPLRDRSEGVRFLWWLSAPMFLLFLAFSLKTGGGEANWPVTAYLSGSVLAAGWLVAQLQSRSRPYRRSVRAAVALSCLAGLLGTVVMHHSEWVHPLAAPWVGLPTSSNPFPLRRFDPTCRLRGWRTLAGKVDALRRTLAEQGQDPVLAAYNWSLPGELGVYCAGHPQAYSIGLLQGDRHSQYDYWTNPIDDPGPFLGRSFLVVGGIRAPLAEAFETVEGPFLVTHREGGRPLARWGVYVCHNFRGFRSVPTTPALH